MQEESLVEIYTDVGFEKTSFEKYQISWSEGLSVDRSALLQLIFCASAKPESEKLVVGDQGEPRAVHTRQAHPAGAIRRSLPFLIMALEGSSDLIAVGKADALTLLVANGRFFSNKAAGREEEGEEDGEQ